MNYSGTHTVAGSGYIYNKYTHYFGVEEHQPCNTIRVNAIAHPPTMFTKVYILSIELFIEIYT